MISKPIYLKVKTRSTVFIIKIVQADSGVFGTVDKLDIYIKEESGLMPTTYKYLSQCSSENQIDFVLRMNIEGIIRIETT